MGAGAGGVGVEVGCANSNRVSWQDVGCLAARTLGHHGARPSSNMIHSHATDYYFL